MRRIKKEEYTIVNGKKFFYTSIDKNYQCAHCLYGQNRRFIRNKDGLIIGLELKPEDEFHSFDCKQK